MTEQTEQAPTVYFDGWARDTDGIMKRTGAKVFSRDSKRQTEVMARTALDVIEAPGVVTRVYMDPESVVSGWSVATPPPPPAPKKQPGVLTFEAVASKIVANESVVFGGRLTVVAITMDNGHIITGESCCDTADAFNEETGMQLAMDAALMKAYQFELYLQRARQKPFSIVLPHETDPTKA